MRFEGRISTWNNERGFGFVEPSQGGLMALAGGWPGALLVQQHLRHKSATGSFRAVFWMTVVLNVVTFVVPSSPGRQALWVR